MYAKFQADRLKSTEIRSIVHSISSVYLPVQVNESLIFSREDYMVSTFMLHNTFHINGISNK